MRPEHLRHLACPRCKSGLTLASVGEQDAQGVIRGMLACSSCSETYPIIRNIPRFVSPDNYAGNFGFQWNKFAQLQYDSHIGLPISRKRFFTTTGWPEDMTGQLILDAGCGGGRFSEISASTGAMVVAFDLSSAVEANYRLNGHRENLLIVQADIYNQPFRDNYFDKVYCLGVIQHTPDVRQSFRDMTKKVRAGGQFALDVYSKHKGGRKQDFFRWLGSYRRMRFITKHLPPLLVFRVWKAYVELCWPLARRLWKSDSGKKIAQRVLLMKDFLKKYDVSDELRKNWIIMNGIDGMCARYENRQHLKTIAQWFVEEGFQDAEVFYGPNGVNGRGVKALARKEEIAFS